MKNWVPDYSNQSSTNLWASGSSTTIAENGFVSCTVNSYKINEGAESRILINGKVVVRDVAEARNPNNAVVANAFALLPVSNGDVVSYDARRGSMNIRECYFIPGKWA